jgi:hypothetical protein
MRKECAIIFLVSLFIARTAFSQKHDNNHRINAGNIKHEWYFSQIFFVPLNNNSNKVDSLVQYCEYKRIKYYLEGLEVSKKTFLDLNIKPKDLAKNGATYNYQYKNEDTTACVEFLNLNLKTTVQVKLNGMELNEDEKQNKLRNLTEENLSIIFRKKCFGRSIIEITTK